jgi:hypothetical protein
MAAMLVPFRGAAKNLWVWQMPHYSSLQTDPESQNQHKNKEVRKKNIKSKTRNKRNSKTKAST